MNIFPFGIFRIEGESMEPTLGRHDFVFIWRVGAPRVGNMVVLRHPADRTKMLIKRITAEPSSGIFFVAGDNPLSSTDSAEFGPVSKKEIIGKVWKIVRKI